MGAAGSRPLRASLADSDRQSNGRRAGVHVGMKARLYFWIFMLAAVAVFLLVGCGKGGGY